nr:hypothetical protein [Tanacetum cinerariifolium]
MELECAKVRGDLLSNKMEQKRYSEKYTHITNDLNQTISELQHKLSAHQDTISILQQQKDAQIKLYKTREDKDIEKVIDLENKVKVLDNIVYKTGQSVQTMNILNNKCRTSFTKPEYLKKAKQANPRLYDIGCYNDNLALMLSPESDEVIRLEKESRSKLSDLVRPFDYAKLNSLYDLFVPQREKSSEQRFFSELSRISHINAQKEKKERVFSETNNFLETRINESISGNKKCQSSFEIENIQRDINTIITGVVLCKQKIANPTWYGHVEPVVKNTIEQNFDPVISKINVGLHIFLKRLNEEMVADLRYFNYLESEVDSITSQLETQKTQTTRANPGTTTTTTTISVINAQLEALIKQGIAKALAARNANRNTNGDDSYVSKTDLKKKMTDKHCPKGEIKKLESELWNLRVKSNDVVNYNQRFQELALLCVRMFLEESDKIKRYVGGFPDVIHGSVVASRPKTMQEAIEMANELMEKRNNTWAERQAENKRKFDDTSRNNQSQQQQQNKRQILAGLTLRDLCNKVGHFARDCRSTANVNNANNQRGNRTGQKPTCYECGSQGYFNKDCLNFKKNNRGTQGGNATAPAKVYVVGRAGTNPDSNIVTGTFLLNNGYAFILFDIGADRSFVSTAFNSQIAITPTTLDHYYDVELADGRIIGLNSIFRGCTLNFLNHPFNIDLMPIELGSFDAIIGMDWLAKCHAIIVCAEKIVRIPWGNEILIVHGNGNDRGNETCLNIISCTKTQ